MQNVDASPDQIALVQSLCKRETSDQSTEVVSLSKRGYAKRHGFSERTLDNFVAGGMPVLRISTRKLLFPIADCDAWLRERFLVARKRPSNLKRRIYVPSPTPVLGDENLEGEQ